MAEIGVTTVAQLDSIIQTIVAETQFTARHKTVMRQLVRVLDMPEHEGSPIDRPKIGKLVAGGLVEGMDIASPQPFTDTDVSINPTEVGLQSVLTDRMIRRAPSGFREMAAEEHARAYAEKMDTDLLGLFSGFSTGISNASNALTVDDLGVGRTNVKGNSEPGPDPLYGVLHPYQAWDIHRGLVPIHAGSAASDVDALLFPVGGVSEMVLREAGIGRLFGVTWFEDGNISTDSGDDAYGAVFSKEAIMLIVTSEGSMRPERDESLRAWELNYVGEYGFAEWVDSYGFYLFTDAAAPS